MPRASRPFRFGVQLHSLPVERWAERARRIEALGYSTIFWPDHFGTQWDPTTALAAVAAVTDRLHVGTLVYDVDYRHPVIHAKAAATLHLLSGGRHEFGIGAGWMETDYVEAGIPYERPGVRIERLEEAIRIARSMWTQERTSFAGKHYTLKNIAQAAKLPAGEQPKVLVGGGGKRVLSLAGRLADIVGINPSLVEGKITRDTAKDLAPERLREKVAWVREAAAKAGRPDDAIELNSLVFVVGITDQPAGLRNAVSQQTGMSVDEVRECPLFLTGSAAEIREGLERRRELAGLSYVVIQGDNHDTVERFAEEIVKPLAGR
ncbi:MAG TPA: TIGR03621 family F420-dependent LLM class oxidoreductase [Myxococcota bacterium]|jgi:probable F420-dependent oxidoreductase|nr:TIGR03621 family F420-dependent LLM class oxidoreductase [Myxococcota bacterium]